MKYSHNIIKKMTNRIKPLAFKAGAVGIFKIVGISLFLYGSVLFAQQVPTPPEDPIEEKIAQLEKWASTGNTNAPYDLGILYIEGAEVEQDYQKAFKWMKTSADNGHINAYYNVGLMYMEGVGVKRDPQKAFHYMEIAAHKGSTEAQYFLAWMYQTGLGVKQDQAEAASWYLWLGETGLKWDPLALTIFSYYSQVQEPSLKEASLRQAYANCLATERKRHDVTLLKQIITSKMSREQIRQTEQFADVILRNTNPLLRLFRSASSIEPKDFLPMEDAIVFGYDSSRSSSASETVSADQLKGWILGGSGVLWEHNRDGFTSLGTWKTSEFSKEIFAQLLSEWWGIESREELLNDLYGLSQGGGHRDKFARYGQWASKMTSEQLEDFLNPYAEHPEKCNDLRIAHQYYDTLGGKGIIGWDLSRYLCLCRWGYISGLLDEKTAWELMIPIARRLQQTFDSWEELGENYLIGRQYWSLKRYEESKERYNEAFLRLTEMPSSPWNLYPWKLNLSGAYEQICDPLPSDSFASASSSDTEGFLSNDAMTSKIETPQQTVGQLSMPDLSKTNTLEELQEDGEVLVVPDQYSSIQTAVDAVEEGATIFIKEGVYAENVSVTNKDDIRIVGQNASNVILRSKDPDRFSVLHIENCRDVIISDLTVAENLSNSESNSSVTVMNADFEMTRCHIMNERGTGISCYSGASGQINNCLINACSSNGVSLSQTGTDITISGCFIWDNKGDGVSVFLGAKATVCDTSLERNWTGIVITKEGTSALVTNCHITESAVYGMRIRGASIEARNNICENNKRTGISVTDGASSNLTDNICKKNGMNGIGIQGNGTSAVLERNHCSWNEWSGISFSDGASGTIDGNVCENNKSNGVLVFKESSQAKITKNHCSRNGKAGIRVAGGASSKLTDNVCNSNRRSGIEVYNNGTSAVLQKNHCLGNKRNGIFFSDSAVGTIQDCICEENIKSGIVVFEKDTQADLIRNECRANKYNGIYISDRAGPEVNLTENICINNYPSGIFIGNGSVGKFRSNVCRLNPWAGIAVRGEGTDPVLAENNFSGNGTWGILVWAGAEPTLNKNATDNNGIDGVMIRESDIHE